MEKVYNKMYWVWKSKYVVNFHDWIKQHNDWSKFLDIKTFSNEKEMLDFIKELELEWYTYSN